MIGMGAHLSVLVDGATLGRIFNVLEKLVDNLSLVDTHTTSFILKSELAFIQLDTITLIKKSVKNRKTRIIYLSYSGR